MQDGGSHAHNPGRCRAQINLAFTAIDPQIHATSRVHIKSVGLPAHPHLSSLMLQDGIHQARAFISESYEHVAHDQ